MYNPESLMSGTPIYPQHEWVLLQSQDGYYHHL